MVRPNVVAAAAAAALALLFACVGDAPKLPDSQCDGTDTYCNGACASTQTDPRNCGACGKTCNLMAGEVCQKGACGPSCTGGTTRCGTGCIDVMHDPQNCGDCGKRCAVGEACGAGKCALLCEPGLMACPRAGAAADAGAPEAGADAGGAPSTSACVDPMRDARNCGNCGMTCPPDKPLCEAGACKIGKFAGVLTNVSQDDLSSEWQECFSETYGTTGTTIAMLRSTKCTQATWLVACRQVGMKVLVTAAEAPRIDVMFDVGSYTAPGGQGAVHPANGTEWYYHDGSASLGALGYAALGDGVQRSNCDIATGLYPEKRLCWHAQSVGTLYGGYRCGTNVNLNSSTQYERVIFEAP